MFRTKLIATVGTIAAAAACILFAAPAATAAPTTQSAFTDCISCWTPRSAPMTAPDLGAAVGSAVLRVSL